MLACKLLQAEAAVILGPQSLDLLQCNMAIHVGHHRPMEIESVARGDGLCLINFLLLCTVDSAVAGCYSIPTPRYYFAVPDRLQLSSTKSF
jgi:hypothetical protein